MEQATQPKAVREEEEEEEEEVAAQIAVLGVGEPFMRQRKLSALEVYVALLYCTDTVCCVVYVMVHVHDSSNDLSFRLGTRAASTALSATRSWTPPQCVTRMARSTARVGLL